MAKTKSPRSSQPRNKKTEEQQDAPSGGTHAVRETIESIVIAFVLAFLFRTFEAEAFVIPTGSMSPALQGRHKDVDCSECGYRFRVSASEEEGDAAQQQLAIVRNPRVNGIRKQQALQEMRMHDTLGGICPMCRQTMIFRTDLEGGVPNFVNLNGVEDQPSYPGDRILVNKYGYAFQEPQRWDVVVFKFPGNGEMNYIKRLVGLPGETLRVYQGDVFSGPLDNGEDFHIEQKPAGKVATMLQTVHDTDYEPTILHQAGWPQRWAPTDDGWEVDLQPGEQTVQQQFLVDTDDDSIAWLRYRHMVPTDKDWGVARTIAKSEDFDPQMKARWLEGARPQLIRDFNSYNARKIRNHVLNMGWTTPQRYLGMHWVGDLAVDCEVQIEKPQGELVLDLVEAGKHFFCTIDINSGVATLGIDAEDDYHPSATTSVNSTGSYRLRFANVDDRLLLWVDGDAVDFGDTTYDVDSLFGERKQMIPRTSADDPGDLSPVGVGARGAALKVTRLQVLRDIYYVATKWSDTQNITDYRTGQFRVELPDGTQLPALTSSRQLFVEPATWPRFLTRQHVEFPIEENQFFVMGDNSPESMDCRLWKGNPRSKGVPGGAYLDRRLLTGKAVCVFWPHSWGSVPGIKVLPGFPNFGDMRIVR
jgi:signal peptidase I